MPQPPLPLPPNAQELGINPALPAYRQPDATPPFRLKDIFLWNLHEALITPDQFATILMHDLDLPASSRLGLEISNQIRSQLEEYAGVALHPLFHTNNAVENEAAIANGAENPDSEAVQAEPVVTASATTVSPNAFQSNNEIDPDDAYRCIVNLNVHLQDKLFTDRFEWSLLHPVGLAERFARQTCADLGLAAEWATAVAHAIYEAVLRLKKEACESGGLFLASSNGFGIDLDNMCASNAGAGWRLDNESYCSAWEPKLERLSKDDVEKREGDRERQLRRLRRETARFSSTANISAYGPPSDPPSRPPEEEETRMGRGERSKRKRRFKSLSPVARSDLGMSGYGGGGDGTLNDWWVVKDRSMMNQMLRNNMQYETGLCSKTTHIITHDRERQSWRCSHCLTFGSAVWGVRDGPKGRRTLCSNCGLVYERDKRLPAAARNLHLHDVPLGR